MARDLPVGECVAGDARTPMLLCNAGYYGTLAAVRSLGRAGVPIVTIDPAVFAVGRYSRYSNAHLTCPSFENTNAWADWLLRLKNSDQRPAIYATSDAVSFALASRRDELEWAYRLYQPDIETMIQILDKGRLVDHARAVGMDMPMTWLPNSRDEAVRIARDVDGVILVKPRSQLAVRNQIKGALAGRGVDAILAAYDRVVEQGTRGSEFARLYPEAMQPMLQTYHAEAMETVYSLSGFRDVSGKHVAMLGARKVLQRPRRLGVGLCFEEAAVDPDVAARAIRLCERIGYYGAFELEFILTGGRALLIDFNARFYNQMVFDTARGLDLPGLVYAATMGDTGQVERLVSAVPTAADRPRIAFCNRFGFEVTMRAQRALGTMSREEVARWRDWQSAPGRRIIDAVHDAGDRLPVAIDVAQQIYQCMRHPRAFLAQSGLAR